jgi:hypothetical protein
MSTNSKPGIGAILNRWNTDATAGVWEEVVEVTQLGFAGGSREVIDVFKLNSTDEYMNKVQGILNSGEVTATVLYTRAQYIQLKQDLETRGNIDYQLVLPDGEALEWSGFISETPLDIGSGDVMQGEITIVIDGKADFVTTAT